MNPGISSDSIFSSTQLHDASDESGDWEIYATSFPSGEGKWQVFRAGGTESRWRGDGKEIFYIGSKATMRAVG